MRCFIKKSYSLFIVNNKFIQGIKIKRWINWPKTHVQLTLLHTTSHKFLVVVWEIPVHEIIGKFREKCPWPEVISLKLLDVYRKFILIFSCGPTMGGCCLLLLNYSFIDSFSVNKKSFKHRYRSLKNSYGSLRQNY